MPEHETVYLDELDGFGFEQLCERIYQRLDGITDVKRIGGVADGGRDLVVHGPQGKVIVECKHQPGSSIGRPVVQKLHSAVIAYGGAGGAILATGRYTKSAIEYAESLTDVQIRLYDRYRLADLAEEAGIRLVSDSDDSAILSFPAPDAHEAGRQISAGLDLESRPDTVERLLEAEPERVDLEPYYVVRADIHQDFSTSVGVIHSVHKSNVHYIFDAKDGRALGADAVQFLAGSALADPSGMRLPPCPASRPDFVLGTTALKGVIEAQMISDNTATVAYMGRNNRRYTKTCTPGPRSIRINDIKQARLPRYFLNLRILDSRYPCSLVSNGRDSMVECPGLHACAICKEGIEKRALLCNSCGAIAHAPKRFGSHSHACKECKKTVCRGCAFQSRRLLFFKRTTCRQCASPNAKRLAGG